MITKQQQLEWLAKRFESLPCHSDSILMSDKTLGYFGYGHKITNQELKLERDKMSSKPVVDNAWHERGELPPVGVPVELWWGGLFAYNCEFITRRGHQYVMWNLDADRPDASDYMNSEFRPLRTEREKAIDSLAASIGAEFKFEGYALHTRITRSLSELIYDAGYRKVKP